MGVTIPEAYQYDRPIPRGQAGIAQYRVPEPVPESNAGAQALAVVGQEVVKTGNEMEKWRERLDVTAAQEAVNKLRQARSDLTVGEDGFIRYKAGDVINRMDPAGEPMFKSYPTRFKAQMDEIGGKLTGRARQLYDSHAATELRGFSTDVVKHGLTESEKWDASVFKNTVVLTQNQGIANSHVPGALEAAGEKIHAAVLARYQSQGLAGEAEAFAARSDMLKLAITQKIATGDSSAIGLFEANKDKLDGKDRVGLQASIKTMALGADAAAWVAGGGGGSTVDRAKFIATIAPHALEVSKATGLDPRLVIAQSALETGYGRAAPGNNFFGIKSHGRAGGQTLATTEVGPGGEYKTNDSFRTYGGPSESAKDYAQFLKSNSRYAPVLAAKGLDAQIEAMGKSGYATDPNYATKLRQIANSLPDPNVAQGDNTVMVGSDEAPKARDPLADPLYGQDNAARRTSEDGVANALSLKIQIEERRIDLTQRAIAESGGNLDVQAARIAAVEKKYSQGVAQLQLYKDQLWNSINDDLRRDPTKMPSADKLNQLDPKQVESLERQVNRAVEGKKTVTNQQVWYNIHAGLTSGNANERETWAAVPLFQFKEHLSDQDFQELANKQAAARKGDDKHLSRVQTLGAQVNSALMQMGIDPTPKPGSSQTKADSDAKKSATFHRAFQNELTLHEEKTGKPAEERDAQTIIDGLMKKVATADKNFWGNPTEKPVALLDIADVPDGERTKIIIALRRNGQTPSDAKVLETYRHSLMLKPRGDEIAKPWPTEWEPTGGGRAPDAAVPSAARAPALPRVIDNPEVPPTSLAMPRPIRLSGPDDLRRSLGLE